MPLSFIGQLLRFVRDSSFYQASYMCTLYHPLLPRHKTNNLHTYPLILSPLALVLSLIHFGSFGIEDGKYKFCGEHIPGIRGKE